MSKWRELRDDETWKEGDRYRVDKNVWSTTLLTDAEYTVGEWKKSMLPKLGEAQRRLPRKSRGTGKLCGLLQAWRMQALGLEHTELKRSLAIRECADALERVLNELQPKRPKLEELVKRLDGDQHITIWRDGKCAIHGATYGKPFLNLAELKDYLASFPERG